MSHKEGKALTQWRVWHHDWFCTGVLVLTHVTVQKWWKTQWSREIKTDMWITPLSMLIRKFSRNLHGFQMFSRFSFCWHHLSECDEFEIIPTDFSDIYRQPSLNIPVKHLFRSVKTPQAPWCSSCDKSLWITQLQTFALKMLTDFMFGLTSLANLENLGCRLFCELIMRVKPLSFFQVSVFLFVFLFPFVFCVRVIVCYKAQFITVHNTNSSHTWVTWDLRTDSGLWFATCEQQELLHV